MAQGKYHHLKLYETQDLFELQTFAPGVYEQILLPEGNSVLSSVFVESADGGASISVRWYQHTTGEKVGEQQDLQTQGPFGPASAGTTDTEIITRIHNKPICEITVTGGSARLGVYVTVVSQFASDLDAALQADGEPAEPEDKGIPIMCYDEAADKYWYVRCTDGALAVTTEDSGTPFHTSGSVSSDPGNEVTVFSFTVPGGTTRKLKRLNVETSSPGCYSLQVDAVEVASGIMHETRKNLEFVFDPARPVAAGSSVVLKYTADTTPTYVCPVKGYLSATDTT